MHCTSSSSQCWPAGHLAVQAGCLMHWTVPLLSSQRVPAGQSAAAQPGELLMQRASPLLSSQVVPAGQSAAAQAGGLTPPLPASAPSAGTGTHTAAPCCTRQTAFGGQPKPSHGSSSAGTQRAPVGISTQVIPVRQVTAAQLVPAPPPPPPSSSQASCTQAPPGCVQMPQLALQHTCPAPQVLAPHFCGVRSALSLESSPSLVPGFPPPDDWQPDANSSTPRPI